MIHVIFLITFLLYISANKALGVLPIQEIVSLVQPKKLIPTFFHVNLD